MEDKRKGESWIEMGDEMKGRRDGEGKHSPTHKNDTGFTAGPMTFYVLLKVKDR